MKTILLAAIIALSVAPFTQAAVVDQNHGMMMDCPMKVQGAELSVADVPDGVALSLTTKEGDVSELRRRAEKMANMHNEPSMMNGGMMVPFTAKYEEIPNGARLLLTPKDPAQLETLRAQARQHAERMKNGECTMMQGTMKGMMQGMVPKTEPAPKPNESEHGAHQH
jgi:hypothetical protein